MTSPAPERRRLRAEVLIVLGLSLGQSGVIAVWTLVKRYLEAKPIASQTQALHHGAYSTVSAMDLIRQLLTIGFALVPVALAFYLLTDGTGRARDRLGLVWGRGGTSPWRDVGVGAVLAAIVGGGGLAVYVGGRAIGQNVALDTSGLPDEWWSAAILILSALAAAVLEETVAVGYLMTRLRQMAWGPWGAIAASAVLRGSYHLYQGWPMGVGNAAMGAIFGWYYARKGRVGPLIVAHALLDLVSYIGPELAPEGWLHALRLA